MAHPCGMKESRWIERCATGMAMLMALSGCNHPEMTEHTLVVWDANMQPPDEGFALMLQPQSWNDFMLPATWTVIGDTLKWDELTGMVSAPVHTQGHTWWMVVSPDPLNDERMRIESMKSSPLDTCHLDMEFAYQINLRLGRGNANDSLTFYTVDLALNQEPTETLHWIDEPCGSHKVAGHIRAKRMPLLMELKRHEPNDLSPTCAAKQWLHFDDVQTGFLQLHWEDSPHHYD
jgi:hypothetical protein